MMRSIITPGKIILSGIVLIGLLFTGILVIAMDSRVWIPPADELNRSQLPASQQNVVPPANATQTQFIPIVTPTPNLPRTLPPLRTESEQYFVQSNDSLHTIARNYSVSVDVLLAANDIKQPD